MYCWGWDEQGQLGDPAQNYSNATPVLAEGLSDAQAVDAGYQHSCAIANGGSVWCWGYNRWGRLGNDTTSSANTAVAVLGLTGATAVGTGDNHSCALLGNGSVWCWGHGYHGQLGNGEFTETDVPVQVGGVSAATALAVGGNHACAVVGSGGVKCWGRNRKGQLGAGTVDPDPGVAIAVNVAGISNATALAAGNEFSCALLQGGAVKCWGHGGYGSLGNGSDQDSATPSSVSGIGDALALASGDLHSCVIRAGGAMSCWGYNYFGQVGDGSNRNNLLAPAVVVDVGDVSAIAAGGEHSCARVRAEPINVKCWGHGNFGQLGDGRVGGVHETPLPVYVLGGPLDTIFGSGQGSME